MAIRIEDRDRRISSEIAPLRATTASPLCFPLPRDEAYCIERKNQFQNIYISLERVKADFKGRYGMGRRIQQPLKVNKEFGPIIKDHMKYIVEHANEIETLPKVKAQVSDVKKYYVRKY